MRRGARPVGITQQLAAKATAAVRLPTPRGPWNRYACAGPSTSAALRRRLASSCSGTCSKLSTDRVGDRRRCRERRRATDDPLRKALGELPVGPVDPREKREALALDPVGPPGRRRTASSTGRTRRNVRSGSRPPSREAVQIENGIEAQARVRLPGRRATSRRSGRRRRRLRGRARAGRPPRRAAPGRPRRARPPPTVRCHRRRAGFRAPARRARFRPARASRRLPGLRPQRLCEQLACVDLPDPSIPSKETNTVGAYPGLIAWLTIRASSVCVCACLTRS